MASIEVRPIEAAEVEAFVETNGTGFGFTPGPEAVAHEGGQLELDRTVCAFDGEQMVGASAALSYDLSLPGGATLPTAGVTAVAVRPTHRRQGVLTSMMTRLLEDAPKRGEPLAMLWASESPIYGRFGYGLAIEEEEWSIAREHAALASSPASPGRMRMVDTNEARAAWPEVWERARATRPGMPSRNERRWAARFTDQSWDRDGMSGFFRTQYEEDGRVDGYVIYRVKSEWVDRAAASVVRVVELVAATEAAHAALWRYALDLDLTVAINAPRQAVDDPLWLMLADPRRLIRRRYDAIWLRILDVSQALSARRYAREGRVVLAVEDPQRPGDVSRFALEGGPAGASCVASDESPDLVLPAGSLAAAYLGNARFSTLARAARVEERRPGALAVADAMFATERAPWCPELF